MKCTINFLRNSLRFVPKVIVSFCIPILHSSTFCHLMGRGDSLEKTLLLGKIEGRRRRGQQRTRRLDGITDSVDMSLSKCSRGRTEKPGVLQVAKSRTRRNSNNIPMSINEGLPSQVAQW